MDLEPGRAIRRIAAHRRGEAIALADGPRGRELVEGWAAACRLGVLDVDFTPEEVSAGKAASLDPIGTEPPRRIRVGRHLDDAGRTAAIAHELGHFHLHDDERLEDGHALMSWTGGPASSGRRLPGYSSRQAKEAQANLFADEFLCPSSWLRTRLARGDTLDGVAAELGLPVDMVRRQAVAALLRPATGPESTARPFEDDLDPRQEACASTVARSTLVLGGPGTGKTTIAAARVRRLLAASDDPVPILVLSPRKADAEALHAALADEDARLAGMALFGTVEDLAFEVLARWPGKVERSEDVSVLDKTASLEVLAGTLAMGGKEGGRNVAEVLRSLDVERLEGDPRGAALAAGSSGEALAFERSLALRDAVDPGGLVPLATQVLLSSHVVRQSLRARFQNLVVDDLHDVPAAGVELLAMLAPFDTALATADPSQCVDGFRRRSAAAVQRFRRQFAPEVRRLRDNRRSEQRVRAVVDALASSEGRSAGPAGVRLTVARDEASEAEAVATRVAEIARSARTPPRQAVLAVSHSELRVVADALRRRRLPVHHLGDLKARADVKVVLAFVLFARDGRATSFERAATATPYALSPGAARAIRRAAKPSDRFLDAALRSASRLPGINSAEAARATRLADDAARLRAAPLFAGLVDWLLSPDGAVAQLLRAADSADSRAGLLAMHLVAKACQEYAELGGGKGKDLKDRGEGKGLKDRIDRIGSLDQRTHYHGVRKDPEDVAGVTLATFRASRGREFDVVHVVGLSSKGDEELVDGDALLRVACSRARDGLHLYRPERRGAARVAPLPSLARLAGLLAVD